MYFAIQRVIGVLLWFVLRDKLQLLTPESNLVTYTFGPKTIQHHACPTCGMHPFGEGTDASGKPMAAINVRCLEDFDFAAIPVEHFDGRSM
jgi:hypothetical protein